MLLNFTEGVFSLLQMFLKSYNYVVSDGEEVGGRGRVLVRDWESGGLAVREGREGGFVIRNWEEEGLIRDWDEGGGI